jgi:CHAD domain-containing protein
VSRVSFELEVNESVEAGIRRVVDEQLDSALDELRAADAKSADKAVHAARKRFKRIRALVRLVRPQIGDDVFDRENAAFRDAGGSLGEARDAAVLVQTLDSLKPDVDPAVFAADRRKLVGRRLAVRKRVLEAGNGLDAVATAADEARQRVGQWRIETDGWDALRPGLKRIYRDGRAAFNCAQVGAQPELFHDWRKRVKDLWHQLEILEPIWPPVLKTLADECHALADLLGAEHDLAVLKDVLTAESLSKAQPISPVVATADARRLTLQQDARALGARLFAEKPGAFVKRLGKYWCAWKGEGALQTTVEPPVDLDAAEISAPSTIPDAPIDGAPITKSPAA